MASYVPNGRQQFCDSNGKPLALGTVGMYVVGTLTPSNTWQDSGQTTLNQNPIPLDAGGFATIYGSGSYRQIVKDSLGNVIWDDAVTTPLAVPFDYSASYPTGSVGAALQGSPNANKDASFPITQPQAPSVFSALKVQANGVGYSAFEGVTVNGTMQASTNSNFLATATPDVVTFSGWGLRGGAGTNPLICANFGAWFENNTAPVWSQEIDCNNEGATQSEGSDSGGIAIAVNTGSTYSPDTGISIRRMTGAGTGPGFLRGLNIEGARNVGVRVMALSSSQVTTTPAAPNTISAYVAGIGGDTNYRYIVDQNGTLNWGPGNAATDCSLQRSGVGAMTANYSMTFGGNITAVPAASATPASNGQMTFELTNNTTLKIKVKGSDGTVRSTTLTLA